VFIFYTRLLKSPTLGINGTSALLFISYKDQSPFEARYFSNNARWIRTSWVGVMFKDRPFTKHCIH